MRFALSAILEAKGDRVSSMVSDVPPDPPGSPANVLGGKEAGDEGSSVGKSVTLVTAKPATPSWVSIAQDKRVLKKYEISISNKDGVRSVEIPDEVLSSPTPLWEDFIVGKFLDISPHVAKVHMVLNKIWKYGEVSAKVEVFEVNATTMRFRVSNPKAREKILKRGMWNIVGVPMVVSKWTPRAEEDKQEEEATPMWVHLRGVPLHMYSWEGISFITSAVGFPVKLHPETIACTNFEVAKVFVKVDVSKALPKEINFSKHGKEFVVDFQFPWLPARCKVCDKWGHAEESCVLKVKSTGGKTMVRNTEIEVVQEVISPQLEEQGPRDKSVEETPVVRNLEEETAHKEEEEVNEEVDGITPKEANNSNDEVNEEQSNWALVSPAKVGRSPENHREGIHISASKFSVLSVEEEEEGEILDRMKLVEVTEMEGVAERNEERTEEATVNQETAHIRETKGTGAKKKAKSLDSNPMAMSTRSSRRQQ